MKFVENAALCCIVLSVAGTGAGCASSKSQKERTLVDALCPQLDSYRQDPVARAKLNREILDRLRPRVMLAVLDVDVVSEQLTTALVWNAEATTEASDFWLSSVTLGVPGSYPNWTREAVAPVLGEPLPKGHIATVKGSPMCDLTEPGDSENPLCRVLKTAPMINPLTWTLGPAAFLPPSTLHQYEEPTMADWQAMAPKTDALFRKAQSLLPAVVDPQREDWNRLARNGGFLVSDQEGPLAVNIALEFEVHRCNVRIEQLVSVELSGSSKASREIQAKFEHGPILLDALGHVEMKVMDPAHSLSKQQPPGLQDDLQEGVVCRCSPLSCDCRRGGPIYAQSNSRAPLREGPALCCATPLWPKEGECSCSAVGCRMYGKNCRCGFEFETNAPPVDECPQTLGTCCEDWLGCTCYPSKDCPSNSTPVESCKPSTVQCQPPDPDRNVRFPYQGESVASCEVR